MDVTLRPFEDDDLPRLRRWLAADHVRPWFEQPEAWMAEVEGRHGEYAWISHFVIEADGNSQQNVYIQSATLNGKPLDKNYITYKDIADGGVMRLVMGPEPNKERGTGKDAAPFSLSRPE